MTNKKPFVNWVLHGIELPLHQNLIYWPSLTAALEQSLGAIWDAASQAAVLILPQIKLNSQLSSCTSFFFFKSTRLNMIFLFISIVQSTESIVIIFIWIQKSFQTTI